MRKQLLIGFLVQVFMLGVFCSIALCQIPYVPDPVPPSPSPQKFPNGSDMQTWNAARETMNQFNNQDGPLGGRAAQKYGNSSGTYPDHPWKSAPYNTSSAVDWATDSFKAVDPRDLSAFGDCMEPRLISPYCPMCWPTRIRVDGSVTSCPTKDNSGEIWEYWWPEYEVEINQFGVASINVIDPASVRLPRPDLVHEVLSQQLETGYELAATTVLEDKWMVNTGAANIPPALRNNPHLGNSAHAGIEPPDLNSHSDAHIYRSYLQDATSRKRPEGDFSWGMIWNEIKVWGVTVGCYPLPFPYNGYKKGNEECFFDTLQKEDDKNIWGWTEQLQYQSVWRIPDLSALINYQRYAMSSPAVLMGLQITPEDFQDSQYDEASGQFGPPSSVPYLEAYLRGGTCASYRARQSINGGWNEYRDLMPALGVAPGGSYLKQNCYRGGGQLYPLTGSLSGHHSSMESGAVLARRAIELMTRVEPLISKPDEALPKFADGLLGDDSVDKLQMVFPAKSQCLKMDQINDRSMRGIYPKDGNPDDNGSKRFLYWNKRIACTCPYRGNMWPQDERFRVFGWGCYRFPYADRFNPAPGITGAILGIDKDDAKGDFYKGDIHGWDIGWPAAAGSFAESAAKVYPFIP